MRVTVGHDGGRRWDRAGALQEIKDQIDQARQHKHDLLRWLNGLPG